MRRAGGVVLIVGEEVADLAALLRASGFVPSLAIDADSARLALGRLRPALILLDWTLSSAGDPRLLEDLRTEPRFRDLPVCVVGGGPGFRAPAGVDLLTRPLDGARLVDLVRARVLGLPPPVVPARPAAPAPSPLAEPAPAPNAIQIVADDPAAARLMVTALRDAGYDTRVTRDRASALAALADGRPALLLLDWDLADASGRALLEHVRLTWGFQAVPVCIVSSDIVVPPDDVAYLPKPVDLIRLLEIVIGRCGAPGRRRSRAR